MGSGVSDDVLRVSVPSGMVPIVPEGRSLFDQQDGCAGEGTNGRNCTGKLVDPDNHRWCSYHLRELSAKAGRCRE